MFLNLILDLDFDRWHYKPGLNVQSVLGLLGSTCHMNGVLQQLFHIFPFMDALLSYKMTEK